MTGVVAMIIKRGLSFAVNLLAFSAPVLIVALGLIFYMLSGPDEAIVAGQFALYNILLAIPILYLIFSLIFFNQQTPGERLLKLELDNKNLVIVLKRTLPFVTVLFVFIYFNIYPLLLLYPAMILFRKDQLSLADIFSKTKTVNFQSKETNSL